MDDPGRGIFGVSGHTRCRHGLVLPHRNASAHLSSKFLAIVFRFSMKAFTKHTGRVVAMDRANVDTDQIIPKQFLKRIERTGFGEFLFWDWSRREDGSIIEEFELNRPESKGASVLLARVNFGCGFSREHAPWALED